jgi:hypothetical protein
VIWSDPLSVLLRPSSWIVQPVLNVSNLFHRCWRSSHPNTDRESWYRFQNLIMRFAFISLFQLSRRLRQWAFGSIHLPSTLLTTPRLFIV